MTFVEPLYPVSALHTWPRESVYGVLAPAFTRIGVNVDVITVNDTDALVPPAVVT